jgi:hypothetical protein
MRKDRVAAAGAIAAVLALAFCVYAASSRGAPVCTGDCVTYIALMNMRGRDFHQTLLSMLWPWAIPAVKPWGALMLRPWAVPLFFSMFGKFTALSASRIALAQTVVAFLAWTLFGFSCLTFVRNKPFRPIFFIGVASLMFGQGYQHFNRYMGSDSLALSSVLVQFSLCLLFSRVARWCSGWRHGPYVLAAYVAALVLVSAFEMATRDANIPLALVGVAFILIDGSYGVQSEFRLLTILLVMAVAVPTSVSARVRHVWNAENILAGAVLPNPDMRSFFIQRGLNPELQGAAAKLQPQDLAHVDIYKIMAEEQEYQKLYRPFVHNVDGVYAQYLALHPGYVLDNSARHLAVIFDQTFESSEKLRPATTFSLSLADHIPLFAFPILVLLYLVQRDLRRNVGYWPALLALIGAADAVLGFFGDVWDVADMSRHALIGSVLLRTGAVLCLLFTLDNVWRPCALALRRRWPWRMQDASA